MTTGLMPPPKARVRNTFERSDASLRDFKFTNAEKRRIEHFCPEANASEKALFIERIELAVTVQSLPIFKGKAKERRRRMEQIAGKASALHGLLNSAPIDTLSDVLHGTQAAIEPLGLSIVDRDGRYSLSAVIAAIEATARKSLQLPLPTNEQGLILQAAFAYQMAFGLKPTSAKNSAFRRALDNINVCLDGRRPKIQVQFPTREIAIRETLKDFGCKTLPTAKRGRKRKNALDAGQK